MCGIAGIIGEKSNFSLLEKMLETQKHRGPDYTGKWFNKAVALGHNRLSILDLSEKSNQPFFDKKNRFALVFNGEIYNYLELKKELSNEYDFITNSDTEVLLAAYIKWGKQCLNKLNGMFSFAIWDSEEENLFAARDRFGVKPFFYYFNENTFYFASEIKALWQTDIKKIPNKKVWANYFCFGQYGSPSETFWKNINQLAGGHYLEFKKQQLTINKWYFFEKEVQKNHSNLTSTAIKKKYTELLLNSIKIRFRADVSVGFNISGGLDSSTLLTFVNQINNSKKIEAYTFYTNNSNYDELPWVEQMIKTTENPLHKVLLESNEVEKLIKKISFHQDEPFGGIPTLAYAKIFEFAKKNGTTVLLDGQGMDEQWAGYDYYVSNNNEIIQGVSKSPFRKNVLSTYLLKFANKTTYPKPFNSEIKNKQYRDLFHTKIPRSQRFNDRISMAYSTELREPFLDYRLVEYAFSLPTEYKIKNGVHKYLLREIISEYLTESITYAPKRPLQTPQREWLANELRDFVKIQINKIANSKYKKWFDINEMKKEWQDYLDGNQDSSFHIWQWVNFSILVLE